MKKFLCLIIVSLFLCSCLDNTTQETRPSVSPKPSPISHAPPVDTITDDVWGGEHSLYRFVDKENGYIVYFNKNSLKVVPIVKEQK
jgi:hypothetical protein